MPWRACTEAALLVLPRLQPLFGLDRSTGAETWSAPPPGLTSGQGEMEENQRTYSCREPLPRACCSFSPCPHLSICRNIFPNLLRLQLGQLETGNAPSWWCPCRVLDAHVVEQLVLWGGKPRGQVNRVLLPCLGGSGGL